MTPPSTPGRREEIMHSEWPWWMKIVLLPVSVKWKIEDALKSKKKVREEAKEQPPEPPKTEGN